MSTPETHGRCSAHPDVPIVTSDGVMRCPACDATARQCSASFGSKMCVLPSGHGGILHVSASGSAWPTQEDRLEDSTSAERNRPDR